MSYDAPLITPLGVLALSGGASASGYWASLRDTSRRLFFIALVWMLATLTLWALTVAQLDWAWQHVGELLTVHTVSSLLPASVAFAIARGALGSTQRFRVAAAVLVVLVWLIIAFPSAVYTSCMLDMQCY